MKTRNQAQAAGKAHQHPPLTKIAATGASSSRSKAVVLPDVAPELAAVRLIDGRTAARVGGMGLSWWNERVADGVAPQPVFRAHRFTRWRLADVVDFWRDFRPSGAAAVAYVDQAAKASAKVKATRQADIAADEGAAA